MKISVIIPIYNAERFIEKSYESILNQELKEFEIIYVDNNSTDKSVDLIQRISEGDSRVCLHYESKQGAGAARNRGLKIAKGEYIYMFDVDDEIYSGALNKMIDVLDRFSDVEAVFGKMVKSNKGIAETGKPTDETHEIVFKEPPYWGMLWFEDLKTVVGPPAFLYRKIVLEKHGGYNEDLSTVEDTALDIDLGMTYKLAFLDTYVYLYFKHSESYIEKSKKAGKQIFNLWDRLILARLPFYLSHQAPFRYKELLIRQIFSTMGKLIYHTKGIQNRWSLYKSFDNQIAPLTIPLFYKLFLVILVLCPLSLFLKGYIYYWSPWYLNKYLNKM